MMCKSEISYSMSVGVYRVCGRLIGARTCVINANGYTACYQCALTSGAWWLRVAHSNQVLLIEALSSPSCCCCCCCIDRMTSLSASLIAHAKLLLLFIGCMRWPVSAVCCYIGDGGSYIALCLYVLRLALLACCKKTRCLSTSQPTLRTVKSTLLPALV